MLVFFVAFSEEELGKEIWNFHVAFGTEWFQGKFFEKIE